MFYLKKEKRSNGNQSREIQFGRQFIQILNLWACKTHSEPGIDQYHVFWQICVVPMQLLETVRIKVSLKFVRKGPINDTPALVQIMAWRRTGDKPLSYPMMVSLPTYVCLNEFRVQKLMFGTQRISWHWRRMIWSNLFTRRPRRPIVVVCVPLSVHPLVRLHELAYENSSNIFDTCLNLAGIPLWKRFAQVRSWVSQLSKYAHNGRKRCFDIFTLLKSFFYVRALKFNTFGPYTSC